MRAATMREPTTPSHSLYGAASNVPVSKILRIALPSSTCIRDCFVGAKNFRAVAFESQHCYRSGRSRNWLKLKNPAAPAVRREADEDWGR
jgi:hypothetical protein